jgi:hypothetical protein
VPSAAPGDPPFESALLPGVDGLGMPPTLPFAPAPSSRDGCIADPWPERPLYTFEHDGAALAGLTLACRTTLSPRFGPFLRPLPPACAVHGVQLADGVVRTIVGGSLCNSTTVWADAASAGDRPHEDGIQAAVPADVARGAPPGWQVTEQIADATERADVIAGAGTVTGVRVRVDRKVSWEARRGRPGCFAVVLGAGGPGAIVAAWFTDPRFGNATAWLVGAPFRGMTATLEGAAAGRITRTGVLWRGLPAGQLVVCVAADPPDAVLDAAWGVSGADTTAYNASEPGAASAGDESTALYMIAAAAA